MKSILYFGAVLMLAAGVLGFIDYNETRPQQGFSSLYSEVKPVPPAIEPTIMESRDSIVIESLIEKIGDSLFPTKKEKKEKYLDYRDFSRGPLRER
jgi:hypothetical protein